MSVLTTTSWVALLFVLAATARIRHAHNNSTHTLTVPLGSCAEGIKNHFLRSKLASGGPCPNCLQNHEDEDEKDFVDRSEEIRLEAIKHQILSKLGLRAKPNVSRESSPSRDVVLQTLRRANGWPFNSYSSSSSYDPDMGRNDPDMGHNDDFFATTSEIIAFAEQGPRLNGQRLVEFLPPGEGPELRVKSALLWIRLMEPRSTPPQRNATLWAFRLKHHLPNATHLSGKEFNTHTEVAGYTKVAPLTVWQKLDLRQTVLDWYTHRSGERLRLLIDCSGCNGAIVPTLFRGGPSNRPFLVVTTEPVPSRRVRRRALDCSGATGGQCCKEMFYVNFKQLGWDDWVIAPNGYFANYCRGDCSGLRTPDDVVNHHSHLLEEYRRMDRLAGLQPCCTPVKFSSTSLIYYGPDNNIIKRDLPKMVVEECGCP